MTIDTAAPADSGDAIADLAAYYDNLTDEDHARLAAEGETVTLARRPWARSLVWEDGGYVPPLHVAADAHLPKLEVLADTGWVIYDLSGRPGFSPA